MFCYIYVKSLNESMQKNVLFSLVMVNETINVLLLFYHDKLHALIEKKIIEMIYGNMSATGMTFLFLFFL